MMRTPLLILLIFFCAVFSAGLVSAAEISAKDVVSNLGEEKSIEIWLSDAPTGLAGYIITPVLQGEAIADVSFTPSWQFALSSVDSDTQTVSALDLYTVMTPGSSPFLLGTLHILGQAAGEGVLYFDISEMTDHKGEEIEVTQSGITIYVIEEEISSPMVGLQIHP
jgi:hypothetical protein